VFAGPSGSGKSTLINNASPPPPPPLREFMVKLVAEGKFIIEHAIYSGKMYGTSILAVQDIVQSGKVWWRWWVALQQWHVLPGVPAGYWHTRRDQHQEDKPQPILYFCKPSLNGRAWEVPPQQGWHRWGGNAKAVPFLPYAMSFSPFYWNVFPLPGSPCWHGPTWWAKPGDSLETAKREMEYRDKEGFWDLVLINKDLEKTYSKLHSFVTEHYSLWLPSAG